MINTSFLKKLPVFFDPSDRQHRSIAQEFFKTGNWAHTNMRFVVELPWVDVPNTIQNKLLQYYFSTDQTISN